MKAKPIICPNCGSNNTTGYFYGKVEDYDAALKVMKKNSLFSLSSTMHFSALTGPMAVV